MTYVAIASGKVTYDGRLEPITAGVTYIADGHEIVRRYPHMFKKSGSMGFSRGVDRPTHTRSPESSAPKARARKEIELRTSRQSPISVVVHEGARRTIVDEVTGWTSVYEGESRETGGYLFGMRSSDRLALTFAAYAGEDTKRSFGKVLLDVDKAYSVERALHRQRTRERLVGDYHSHTEGCDGVPSPGDLRGWMRSSEMLLSDERPPAWLLGNEIASDCWAGIIVTRSAGGSWMYPQLYAWITRWDYAGFICEPAALEIA